MKPQRQSDFSCLTFGIPAFLLGGALWLAGCSGGNGEQQRAQQAQELTSLREENKEMQKLRTENKELPRLRKEQEELPQLRGNAEELEKLRKDNDRIRTEITNFAKLRLEKDRQAAAQRAQQAAAVAQVRGAMQAGVMATNVADPSVPQEGDEILIDPKFLAKILPQFDWSKLERKEPVAVRALLEQQGISLTNYQQLTTLGITNYVIQHAPKPPPGTVPQ